MVNSCTFSCPEHLEPWGGRFRLRCMRTGDFCGSSPNLQRWCFECQWSLASIDITCLQPLIISQTPKGRDVAPSPWKHAAAQVCPSSFPTKFCFEWGTQPSTASIHYLQKEPQASKKTQHPWWKSNVSPILRNCLPSQSNDAQSSITCQDGAGYHLGFQHPSTMIDRKRDSNSQGHVTAFFFGTNPTKNPNPTPLATLASPITPNQTDSNHRIQEHPRTSYQFHDQIWPCAKGHLLPAPSTRLASLRSWLLTAKRWALKWCLPDPCCIPQFSLMIYCVCIMIPGGDNIKFNDLKPHCCCHGCHLLITPTHQGCLQYDLMSFSRYWSLYFLSANGSGWDERTKPHCGEPEATLGCSFRDFSAWQSGNVPQIHFENAW